MIIGPMTAMTCLIGREITWYRSHRNSIRETEGINRTHRHGPDGDGVALQGVSEVRHHAGANEPVERLDGVEEDLDGDQQEQRQPVVGMRPRDAGAVRPYRGERARRSINAG